jgi:hypothetical protein
MWRMIFQGKLGVIMWYWGFFGFDLHYLHPSMCLGCVWVCSNLWCVYLYFVCCEDLSNGFISHVLLNPHFRIEYANFLNFWLTYITSRNKPNVTNSCLRLILRIFATIRSNFNYFDHCCNFVVIIDNFILSLGWF